MPDVIDGLSMNIEQTNLDKLRSVFPECVSEGKLDIDKLLSLCGEYIDNDFEKYKFEWKGKADCLRLAQKRSTGTLRPCPEESVDWDATQNLYIEGDNLEVLKLLQTAYYRKVKMIYIDPPYNTGHDFIYNDRFEMDKQEYDQQIGLFDEEGNKQFAENPESNPRFHSDWCSMMYPRLMLARNMLADDGVILKIARLSGLQSMTARRRVLSPGLALSSTMRIIFRLSSGEKPHRSSRSAVSSRRAMASFRFSPSAPWRWEWT